MLTFYCPKCWTMVNETDELCPNCGYSLSEFHEIAYEEKLLGSLNHVVAERRIMAAQILGIIHSQRAISEFHKIIDSEENDYYFLRAVLLATAKIDHPDRVVILQKATHKPSALVAEFAKQLLLKISKNESIDEWDRNTG